MLLNILKNVLYSVIFFILLILSLIIYMTWMPNPDYQGNSSESKLAISELSERLKNHVVNLSRNERGRNNIDEDTITPSRNYITKQFYNMGLIVNYNKYTSYGDEYSNIIVDIPSKNKSTEILIIGAHYDSVENSPGADDNASGVAALIELGRYLTAAPQTKYKIRLVAFANEEPPYFQTKEMGSLVYAKSIKSEKENILGMISLETLGYYTNEKGSQKYPPLINLLYPDTGNFVSFIGNIHSKELVTSAISKFRKKSNVPSEGIASPAFVPGIGWSDHWSFWMSDYKAIMITDTAPYRYKHYHKSTDTPDKLNYEQYAQVVFGIFKVVEDLANEGL